MNTATTAALLTFTLGMLADQCRDQPFDFPLLEDTPNAHEDVSWTLLEAKERAAKQAEARWLCRVIFLALTEDGGTRTDPNVLGFPTAPCGEELRDAIYARAKDRGLVDLAAATVLVYDFTTDTLADLADYAPQPEPYCDVTAAPVRTLQSVTAARPMGAARAMLARAGQRTTPTRRRLVAA